MKAEINEVSAAPLLPGHRAAEERPPSTTHIEHVCAFHGDFGGFTTHTIEA